MIPYSKVSQTAGCQSSVTANPPDSSISGRLRSGRARAFPLKGERCDGKRHHARDHLGRMFSASSDGLRNADGHNLKQGYAPRTQPPISIVNAPIFAGDTSPSDSRILSNSNPRYRGSTPPVSALPIRVAVRQLWSGSAYRRAG
jgi:hypothetical protein